MASPIEYAMMVLKQWEDVNWEQPEAVGQYSDNPKIEQMLQPWPEGTNTDWQYGPPQNGEQGPVLSAEQAMQRDKQRQHRAQHQLRYGQIDPHKMAQKYGMMMPNRPHDWAKRYAPPFWHERFQLGTEYL